jgi:Fe-only nitrogenase accessory protein AnfO
MKVAVFVNENGGVLPFLDSGVVEIYSDDKGQWECINQIPFELNNSLSMNEFRMRIYLMVSEFDDCRMLVVETIRGLSLALIEERKIGIWKFKGTFLRPLLDTIKKELERIMEEQRSSIVVPSAIGNAEDGLYEIDLASILDRDSSLNSRDILLPFLQNTSFHKLEVVCKHVPKWFEKTFEVLKLQVEVTELNDGLCKVVVTPVDFDAGISERKQAVLDNIIGSGGCSSGCCSSSCIR